MIFTMKKVIALSLILLAQLLIHPTFSAADSVPDEQFSLQGLTATGTQNKVGVFFEDNADTLRMPTLLYSYWGPNQKSPARTFCNGLDDPACASASYLSYYALMPPCKSSAEFDCIESIYAIAPGSPARIKGLYKESIPEKVDRPFKADPARGLPQGSVSGIWEIPNIKHSGGSTDFVAIVSRVGSFRKDGTGWLPRDQGDFRAAIYPISIVRDSRYKANTSEIDSRGYGVNIGHKSQLPFDVCAVVGNGVCALRQSFPADIQFGMVIRFSKVINGWMHGRIDSPEIDYELTDYGTRVDMKGLSTRVPIAAGWTEASNFTDADKKNLNIQGAMGTTIHPRPSGNDSMNALNIWAKYLNDKAVANPSQWIFYNLPESDMQTASSCIKTSKTLAGFVTTNSTTYTASPPVYNEKSGTLDYSVASLHRLPDGTVFQGKYNLFIDSKVARCIYKFSNAPISATVSITSADGVQKSIATTTVTENNGWIHLSAVGFTFSNPTIKVKLTQGDTAPEIASPAPVVSTPAKKVEKPKRSTITCSKGMTTRKINAIDPKCPKGFKKV